MAFNLTESEQVPSAIGVGGQVDKHGTSHDILEVLFGEIPHHTLLTQDLRYQYSCSKQKMEQVPFTLDKGDLMNLKEERPDGVEVRCDFCANTSSFDGEALQVIIDRMEGTVQ